MQNEKLIELVAWIDEATKGLKLPGDRRARIASACFDVAIEHQAAIALLSRAKLFGSVYALLRVLFEAFVRGAWLFHCATDADLDRFQKGKLKKKFNELIEEAETKVGAKDSALSSIHGKAWSAMNSFTHTGFMQVLRRNSEEKTGPNYDPNEITLVQKLAGVLGVFTAFELAAVAGDDKLCRSVLEKHKTFLNAL
ncbi:MAG: hypothetical protein IPN23_09370 [Elusimicrobia bacterium]|nr:hypothetical protein [Elusimicrobiota bacterium]MBL0249623.1 hypothetical protein [Elusimicrobiota bacterium]